MILIFISLFATLGTFAQVETEFDGNVEIQSRQTWNNPEAKDIPVIKQDWKEEQYTQMTGNLGFKADYKALHAEVNWFGRKAYSSLFQQEAIATQIFAFPNKLVARDVFKLQYNRIDGDQQTDSVLNKFYIEWREENSIAFGRMFINYGLGEIFNPLNPFNQPTGLTSLGNVAQGSDGFRFTLNVSETYSIDFFLLGDKRIDGYDGEIDRTLWVHGEYQANEKLTLDYVIGEDQKRQKIGGQASYQFDQAMVFAQALYQTEFTNKKPSDNLWDLLLGYDQQVTALYHLRFEGGYQKINSYGDLLSFSNRFLPTEYFVSLANIYDIHPLVKLSGTFINDVKTGFSYFIGKTIWSMGNNIESELFMYSPIGKGGQTDQVSQQLITTDVGLALRAFF
ncbi:MAG: hypothetical protein ACOVP4_12210 [Bacteriovoracaceae bacterium]